MTAVVTGPAPGAPPEVRRAPSARPGGEPSTRRRLLDESRLVALVTAAIYGVVAWFLDFRYDIFPVDAVTRMANGFYVLYSRHFHLAAIGFVWNPLTSIADMAPLLFKDLWHPLVTHDVAASLVTVSFMTGAVHQIRSMLQEWGLGRAPRLVLTTLFALNPMIAYYGANGMSEALYVFTTVAVARYLRRWLTENDSRSLVYAATMLALCYLAREEGAAVALFSGALVLVVSTSRADGPRRIMAGLTDTAIYLFLFAATFIGWAFASLVITGTAFAQFTSQYGNSAQLKQYGSAFHLLPGQYAARLIHEGRDLETIAPLLPVLVVLAGLLAIRRRDPQVLVPVSVLGAGVLFTLLGYLDNQIFPWFRFYLLCVPLEVLLAAAILAPSPARRTGEVVGRRVREPRPRAGPIRSVAAAGAALLMVGPALVTTAFAMANPKIGIEESGELADVLHPKTNHPQSSEAAVVPVLPYLERMHLPDGDVLTEDASDCMATAIMGSSNPRIFVITNDSDFAKILADPLTWNTHYVVVPPPSAGYNAVNAAYPDLYRDGAGFTNLVHQFPGTSICPTLRLYRVVRHTGSG